MNIEELKSKAVSLKSKVTSLTDKIPIKNPQVKTFVIGLVVIFIARCMLNIPPLAWLPIVAMYAIWCWRESIITLTANRLPFKVTELMLFFTGLLLLFLFVTIVWELSIIFVPQLLFVEVVYAILFSKAIYAPIKRFIPETTDNGMISNCQPSSNPIIGCVVWTLTECILVFTTLIIVTCCKKHQVCLQVYSGWGLLVNLYVILPLFISFLLREGWAMCKAGIPGLKKCILVTLAIWSLFIVIDATVMICMDREAQKDSEEYWKNVDRGNRKVLRDIRRSMYEE